MHGDVSTVLQIRIITVKEYCVGVAVQSDVTIRNSDDKAREYVRLLLDEK